MEPAGSVATTPVKDLSDAELMQVASGRFVREEVIVTLADNGQGRVLQPEKQQGLAYKKTQAQGHQHQLSPEQAVAQSIARGDMTPRQKQAFEELNRRGTPLPPALQAVKTSYERMERAREQILGSNEQRQQNHLSSQQQEAITELGNRPSELDVETQQSLSLLQPMMQRSAQTHADRQQPGAPRRGPEPPERGIEL